MNCDFCGKPLNNDVIALCKKLLGRKISKFMCLECLADYLDSNKDDLLVKIEEFKENGCALFQ